MGEIVAGSSLEIKKPLGTGKNAALAALLLVIVLISLLGYRAWQRGSTPKATLITAGELQERYGVHLYLLGVTAAGGLVDLRLNVEDGQKAGLLLAEKSAFPVLVVADGTVLQVPEESQSLEGVVEDGGHLFLMFPNAQNRVKPGTPVSIRFGDVVVGPIIAR